MLRDWFYNFKKGKWRAKKTVLYAACEPSVNKSEWINTRETRFKISGLEDLVKHKMKMVRKNLPQLTKIINCIQILNYQFYNVFENLLQYEFMEASQQVL